MPITTTEEPAVPHAAPDLIRPSAVLAAKGITVITHLPLKRPGYVLDHNGSVYLFLSATCPERHLEYLIKAASVR